MQVAMHIINPNAETQIPTSSKFIIIPRTLSRLTTPSSVAIPSSVTIATALFKFLNALNPATTADVAIIPAIPNANRKND